MKKIFSFIERNKASKSAATISPREELKEKDFGKIHKAAFDGKVAELRRLANRKDLNQLDKKNRTALHIACIRGHETVVQFLVESKVHLNHCDKQKRSALMKAVEYKRDGCAYILLRHQADLSLVDVDGNTVLHLASCISSLPVMLNILSHSININAKNKDGFTPLMLAVDRQRTELVKLLIDMEANINIVNHKQQSPLMIAASGRDTDLVRLLLQHGADTSVVDVCGCTAVSYAVNKANWVCANLIREHEENMKLLYSPFLNDGGDIETGCRDRCVVVMENDSKEEVHRRGASTIRKEVAWEMETSVPQIHHHQPLVKEQKYSSPYNTAFFHLYSSDEEENDSTCIPKDLDKEDATSNTTDVIPFCDPEPETLVTRLLINTAWGSQTSDPQLPQHPVKKQDTSSPHGSISPLIFSSDEEESFCIPKDCDKEMNTCKNIEIIAVRDPEPARETPVAQPVLKKVEHQPSHPKVQSPATFKRKQMVEKSSAPQLATLDPGRDMVDVGVEFILQRETQQHQHAEQSSSQSDSIQSLFQILEEAELLSHRQQDQARLPDAESEQNTNHQDEDKWSSWDSESDSESMKDKDESRVMVPTTQHQAMHGDYDNNNEDYSDCDFDITTSSVGDAEEELAGETSVSWPVVQETQQQTSGPEAQRPARSASKKEETQQLSSSGELPPPQRNMAYAEVTSCQTPHHHSKSESHAQSTTTKAKAHRQKKVQSSSLIKVSHQAVQTVETPTRELEEAWTQTEVTEKVIPTSPDYEAMQQKLERIEKKSNSLRKQLEKSKSRCAAKEQAYEELQDRFSCTQKRLSAEGEKRVQLEEEKGKVLEREKAQLQELNSIMEQEKAERENLVRRLQQELEEALKKLATCEASLEVTTHRCSELEKERDASLKDTERLKQQVQERKEQHLQVEKCTNNLQCTLQEEHELNRTAQILLEVKAAPARTEDLKHLEEPEQRMNSDNGRMEATVQQQSTPIKSLQDVQRAAAGESQEVQEQMEANVRLGGDAEQQFQNLENTSRKVHSVEKDRVLQDDQYKAELQHYQQLYGDVDRFKRRLDSKFDSVLEDLKEYRRKQLLEKQRNAAFICSTKARAEAFLRNAGSYGASSYPLYDRLALGSPSLRSVRTPPVNGVEDILFKDLVNCNI